MKSRKWEWKGAEERGQRGGNKQGQQRVTVFCGAWQGRRRRGKGSGSI